jgi:broad specificity phosphatase PhoE
MKVYFVRHAQSSLNAQDLLHQYHEGELSEFGVKQAEFVAKRFSTIPLDVIISSPYERAKETAKIISSMIGREVQFTALLSEFKGPRELEGKRKDDPEVVRINTLMAEHRDDVSWKYSDEESYGELRDRAVLVLDYLAKQPYENILCITHGLFLRVIIAAMMFGKEMQRSEMVHFMRFIRINNTGITVCELLESGQWRLVTLNDHAHLG